MKHQKIIIGASFVCVLTGLLFATLPPRNDGGRNSVAVGRVRPMFESVAAAAPPAPPVFSSNALEAAAVRDAALTDLQWKPVQGRLPYSITSLEFRYEKDVLPLSEPRTDNMVWNGNVGDAKFTEETIAGVHTLKDSGGQILWSDVEETSAPDLLLQKSADGQARLSDKKGNTLWSGNLGVTGNSSSSRSERHGNASTIEANGVRITGENGRFRVARLEGNETLWTGMLPRDPVLLLREGRHFVVQTPTRAESGKDKITRVSFEAVKGMAIVSDSKHKQLGTVPVDLVKITQKTEWLEDADAPKQRATSLPEEHTMTQMPTLTAYGALAVTYYYPSGRAFQRAEVFRMDKRGGTISKSI